MSTTGTDEFNKALEIQQNLVAGLDLSQQETAIRHLIDQEASFQLVLRLLCLYSLVTGGLKPKVLEEFKREILQTYGYEYLPLLVSLADLNILTRAGTSSTKSAFAQVRKPLRLIVDDVDESNPEDAAYVYSGYAPMSVRLVQHALGLGTTSGGSGGGVLSAAANAATGRERTGATLQGWKGLDEVMRTLPGAVFEELQKPAEGEASRVKRKPGHCNEYSVTDRVHRLRFSRSTASHGRLLRWRLHIHRDRSSSSDEPTDVWKKASDHHYGLAQRKFDAYGSWTTKTGNEAGLIVHMTSAPLRPEARSRCCCPKFTGNARWLVLGQTLNASIWRAAESQ